MERRGRTDHDRALLTAGLAHAPDEIASIRVRLRFIRQHLYAADHPAGGGGGTISCGFVIEDPFLPDEVAAHARQVPVAELPDEVLL